MMPLKFAAPGTCRCGQTYAKHPEHGVTWVCPGCGDVSGWVSNTGRG